MGAKHLLPVHSQGSQQDCPCVGMYWKRGRGGGGWNPKNCEPKMAQINISYCKFHSFPIGNLGPGGGGGGVLFRKNERTHDAGLAKVAHVDSGQWTVAVIS